MPDSKLFDISKLSFSFTHLFAKMNIIQIRWLQPTIDHMMMNRDQRRFHLLKHCRQYIYFWFIDIL